LIDIQEAGSFIQETRSVRLKIVITESCTRTKYRWRSGKKVGDV